MNAGIALGQPLRSRFPIFSSQIKEGRPLSYLDTAASSQKPSRVVERVSRYLSLEHANIHRGAYALSANATSLYDLARAKVAKFLNAPSVDSVIFTRGTTTSINLVARSFAHYFKKGDCILLSILEHHSNIVPWQMLAARSGLQIEYVAITPEGALDFADFQKKVRSLKPKLVSVTHVANSIGAVVPIADVIEESHRQGAKVMVDVAHSVAHMPIDVQALDVDFLAFSGHKLYGPTGSGVLYAKPDLLQYMEPYEGGGDMIESVTTEGSTWAPAPRKFEAGTPPIAEVVGLGEAIDFVSELGLSNIHSYEHALFVAGWELLLKEPGVTTYGPRDTKAAHESIIAFNVQGIHPHDFATVADSFNVQIRAGHHCAMPLLKRMGVDATARASIGVYSTREDFEALREAIRYARKMFR